MNKIILLVLILIPCLVFGQFQGGTAGFRAHDGYLVKTFTTYTATSDDTTGWLTIPDALIGTRPLDASRLELIVLATDSVQAALYFIGRNNTLTTITTNSLATGVIATGTSTTTYADSLPIPGNNAYTATLPYFRVIPLVAPGVNRLPGCTQFKIGTVFTAWNQGNTAGRTLKYYLRYVR